MPEVRTPLPPSENNIKILITTDNHVGYKENDPVVGDDSWKSFDEVMRIAAENDVDMVLQSGDLFHVNHPSKQSLYQVLRILRARCLGDRPCSLELLSDPSTTFDDGFNTVNYEDPNINVLVPLFAILGNHDDSTGSSFLSPLDVVGVSGLINHFGRVTRSSDINVAPILLQKGSTKLALYGLANVLDERLFRTFKEGKVVFNRPAVQQEEWFNLMAVHQNHHAHTETLYLPEGFLPSFLDLVVWGHEHECIPYTVTNYETGFEVLQPGSLVATSLGEKETADKHVFVVTICGRDYHVKPVKLRTVRPFVMADTVLQDSGIMPGPTSKGAVTRFLTAKVEELIEKARAKWRDQNPELFEEDEEDEEDEEKRYPLPLIRLRVDYLGDYQVENPRRFSNMFVGQVANPNDVISFFRKKESRKRESQKTEEVVVEEDPSFKVQNYVNEFLKEANLTLIPEMGLNAAVKDYVEKDDKTAIERFVQAQIENATKLLGEVDIEEDDKLVGYINLNRKAFSAASSKASQQGKKRAIKSQVVVSSDDEVEIVSPSDSDEDYEPKKKARKPTRTTKASAQEKRNQPAKRTTRVLKRPREPIEVESSEEEVIEKPKKRGRKKAEAATSASSLLSMLGGKR